MVSKMLPSAVWTPEDMCGHQPLRTPGLMSAQQQERGCVILWGPTAGSLGPHNFAELNELDFSVHTYNTFIHRTHIRNLSHGFGSDPHIGYDEILGTDKLL